MIITKAVFGFGVLLNYDSTSWLQDEDWIMKYEDDFLEWVSQKVALLPLGKMLDCSLEERDMFANTLPVTYVRSLNSKERSLLLTKFHWLLKNPKPMQINFDLDDLNAEILKAVNFCDKIGVSFTQPGWLLGILFD